MDNLGIGTDIENIKRFEKYSKDKNNAFLKRVYSNKEINYCFSHKYPASHLAARYAAKEAVVKAMNPIDNNLLDYKDIEILHSEKETPVVKIKNSKFNNKLNKLKVYITLSHTQNTAIAFALIIKK